MTFHGDCTGPTGAVLYHSTCPGEWPKTYGGVHVCECYCHTTPEEN